MAQDETLHLDREAPAGPHCARSLEEAVHRLVNGEYRTLVVHTHGSRHDEYGILEYLSGTWPGYLSSLIVQIERHARHVEPHRRTSRVLSDRSEAHEAAG